MVNNNLMSAVLQETGGNVIEAQALARHAGAFLSRAAGVASRNRDGMLILGHHTKAELDALPKHQFIAFLACAPLLLRPLAGESIIREGLLQASETCYSVGATLYRRRIPTDVEPLEVTQRGRDREQAGHLPTARPRFGEFMITKGGAWLRATIPDSGDNT